MLDRYFARPVTVDRIQALWLGSSIARYVTWLDAQRASSATVLRHVRTLRHFDCFVRARGATRLDELPVLVQPFVNNWMRSRGAWCRTTQDRCVVRSNARVPVEQLLRIVVPGFACKSKLLIDPFLAQAPGFFPYLSEEKGLRPITCRGYACQLRTFETFLQRQGVAWLEDIAPSLITTFLGERARTLGAAGMQGCSGTLRVFLRYLHRQGIVPVDLSRAVTRGRAYKQASLPRAIAWSDVQRVLAGIDRRSTVGKRDYAILMLLASYGLRAREIAALRLDDLDWKHAQLRVPARKNGHSAVYPLSSGVGEAIVDYLRHARPPVEDRHVFLVCRMPFTPMSHWSVSSDTTRRLRAAGVTVARAGSHTLRHSCVQHLVESDVSFKAIGDYVGHRRAESTLVYAKVALHRLRQLAIGEAEEAL